MFWWIPISTTIPWKKMISWDNARPDIENLVICNFIQYVKFVKNVNIF